MTRRKRERLSVCPEFAKIIKIGAAENNLGITEFSEKCLETPEILEGVLNERKKKRLFEFPRL